MRCRSGDCIESLNATLRKLLHYRGHFPSDEAVTELVYLALTNIEKKCERSVRDWSNVLGQFAVFFKDRLPTLGLCMSGALLRGQALPEQGWPRSGETGRADRARTRGTQAAMARTRSSRASRDQGGDARGVTGTLVRGIPRRAVGRRASRRRAA